MSRIKKFFQIALALSGLVLAACAGGGSNSTQQQQQDGPVVDMQAMQVLDQGSPDRPRIEKYPFVGLPHYVVVVDASRMDSASDLTNMTASVRVGHVAYPMTKKDLEKKWVYVEVIDPPQGDQNFGVLITLTEKNNTIKSILFGQFFIGIPDNLPPPF